MNLIVILVSCFKLVSSINLTPGQPVPHADVLHSILAANILNYTDTPKGSLVDYLFNTKVKSESANNTYNMENLDINVLDVDNLKKIVAVAKRKYSEQQGSGDYRRRRESLKTNPHLIDLAMKQMEQSIYSTRYRMTSTAPLRKQFRADHSYNIALLVGSMNQILLKMENLYNQMVKFQFKTHFIWYLIVYEKILAGHVDVTYIVKRIFQLHESYMEKLSELMEEKEEKEEEP